MKINLPVLLSALHKLNLQEHSDGLEINFSSNDELARQSFTCDFNVKLFYRNNYIGLLIILDPQDENPRIICMNIYGHFIYSGYSLNEATDKINEYFKFLTDFYSKSNNTN